MNIDGLKELKKIGYADIDKNNLINIQDIKIDRSKDLLTRLTQFIDDVKNPYILKCGATIVEVEFCDDTVKTIDYQLENYLKSLKNG